MAADGERLDEGELVEVEGVAGMELVRGQDHALAHAAVAMDAEDLQCFAAVGAVTFAGVTMAAVEVGLDGAAITGCEMSDTRADCEDFDAELMTENARELDEGHFAEIAADVSAADADGTDGDKGFALLWRGGFGQCGPREVFWSGESQRGHGGSMDAITTVLHGDMRDAPLCLEAVEGRAEFLPEVEVRGAVRILHACFSHAEGEDVDRNDGVVIQRGFNDEIDLLDERIGHGEAADADHVAMHHDEVAGALMSEVVLVGVADIEGEMIAAGGVELLWCDRVEAFGGLHVAFAGFRAESAGESGDGIVAEDFPAAVVTLEPEFEFAGFLEDADEGGQAELEPPRRELVRQSWQQARADIFEAAGRIHRPPFFRMRRGRVGQWQGFAGEIPHEVIVPEVERLQRVCADTYFANL